MEVMPSAGMLACVFELCECNLCFVSQYNRSELRAPLDIRFKKKDRGQCRATRRENKIFKHFLSLPEHRRHVDDAEGSCRAGHIGGLDRNVSVCIQMQHN